MLQMLLYSGRCHTSSSYSSRLSRSLLLLGFLQVGVARIQEARSNGSFLWMKLPHALDTHSGMLSDPGDQGPVWQGDAPVSESNQHHRGNEQGV
jgi:hypothetical protein